MISFVRQLGRHWQATHRQRREMLSSPFEAVYAEKLVHRVVSNYSTQLPWLRFLYFLSVVRKMLRYNSNGARPAVPNHGSLQSKWFLSYTRRRSAEAIPALLGLTPREPSNQNPFHKVQVYWLDNLRRVTVLLSRVCHFEQGTSFVGMV